MPAAPLISAAGLSVGYRRKTILADLSFDILPGSLIALVGRNGVGKSTLLRTLTADLRPLGGSLMLEGKPLDSYPPRRLAAKIAVVTTEPLQVGALTVRELVSLGRDPHTGITGHLTADDREAVDSAIEAIGITPLADKFMARLSDGERQKALIARALAQDTPLIILDEPFSFLDVSARIEILSLLRDLCHSRRRAILFSSHDIAQALRMADAVWMLSPDRRLITGTPEEIKHNHLIDNLFDNPNVCFDPRQNDFVARQ